MITVPTILRSIIITSIFAFIAPLLLIGSGWLCFMIISQVPGLKLIGQSVTGQIYQFLLTFGSGSLWQGTLIIGLTCSFVGVLFDTYAFYQNPRSN